MTGDGSEAMPLTDLVEFERYCEWRATECPTIRARASLSASELVDAIERTMPIIRTAAEGAAGD